MSAPIASVDRNAIKADLSELAGKTVENTLSALLSKGADDLVGAQRPPALRRAPLPKRTGQGSQVEEAPVAAMPKAMRAMESAEASTQKTVAVADELDSMKPAAAARCVHEGFPETLAYTRFPREHWRRIRTNNAIERPNREIRRRTRLAGAFPNGKSTLMLVTARLKYVAGSEWGSRRYPDVPLLEKRGSCRRPRGHWQFAQES